MFRFSCDLLPNLFLHQLRRYVPQVRGKVKDAARAKVGDAYGFDDRPSMQQKNRRLYLDLLDQDSYIYEVCLSMFFLE